VFQRRFKLLPGPDIGLFLRLVCAKFVTEMGLKLGFLWPITFAHLLGADEVKMVPTLQHYVGPICKPVRLLLLQNRHVNIGPAITGLSKKGL